MNVEQRSDPDKFLHMYGMAVWNFHLDEHVGGHDLVRGLWEHSEGRPYMLLPMTMEDGLTELGYDFTAIYEDFMAVNTVMDYREHYSFPSVTVRQMVYTLPAEGSVEDSRRPQTLGQDYIRIALSQTDAAKPDLFLSFDGNALGEWRVLLVGTVGQEAREVVSLEVVDGVGEGVLLNVDDFDDAWLVASPLRQASQGFTYQWSLWRDLSPDRPAPGSATGGVDLSSGGFGCACSSSSRWLTWGWALVPLLALLRRRKRLGVAGC